MEEKHALPTYLLSLCMLLAACGDDGLPANPPLVINPTPEPPSATNPPQDEVPIEPDLPSDDPVGVLLQTDNIDPLGTLKIQFNQPVDPGTVTVEEPTLRDVDTGDTVGLEVEYSETDFLLTLTPRTPLAEGKSYVLDIEGLPFSDESAKPEKSGLVQQKTTSLPLPPIIRTRPRLLQHAIVWHPETGEIFRFSSSTYHETGSVWRTFRQFSGPGDDADWLATDDNPVSDMRVTELLDGNSHQVTLYTDPGPNEVWDAGGDDVVQSFSLVENGEIAGHDSTMSSQNPGADGIWFTRDDDYSSISLSRFDKDARIMHTISGNMWTTTGFGPGIDGEWFTGDDIIDPWGVNSYTQRIYDEKFRLIREVGLYRGVDELWFTDDDIPGDYIDYAYDELGRLIDSKSYYIDNIYYVFYFQADPVYVRSLHDQRRYEGNSRNYSYDLSLDSNEEITRYIHREYSGNGVLSRSGVFEKGPDGVAFTADDTSTNFTEYLLDESGLIQESWSYSDVGMDGVAFSGDDVAYSLTKYEYDFRGRLLALNYYSTAGDDGVWDTEDDFLAFRLTYYVGAASDGE